MVKSVYKIMNKETNGKLIKSPLTRSEIEAKGLTLPMMKEVSKLIGCDRFVLLTFDHKNRGIMVEVAIKKVGFIELVSGIETIKQLIIMKEKGQ